MQALQQPTTALKGWSSGLAIYQHLKIVKTIKNN